MATFTAVVTQFKPRTSTQSQLNSISLFQNSSITVWIFTNNSKLGVISHFHYPSIFATSIVMTWKLCLKSLVSAFNSLLCFVKATLSTTIPPCLPILSLTINEGHADRYMEAFHIKWRRRHGCVIEIGHGIHQRGGVYMWGWRKRAKSLLTRVCLRLVLWGLGIQSCITKHKGANAMKFLRYLILTKKYHQRWK